MNQLRDFRLHRYQKGPQKGQESMWLFRIGHCDDAKLVVAGLRSLPGQECYCYADEDHMWAVRPSHSNGKFLTRLFENFGRELVLARKQPELPVITQLPIERHLPWMDQGIV